MPAILKGNYIFVNTDEKCYKVVSNFTNYIQLGLPGITSYYFEAKIFDNEFLVSARMLDEAGNEVCLLENSFVTQHNCRKMILTDGYKIIDNHNNTILELRIINKNICLIKCKIYGANGELIAEDKNDDFVIYKGPAYLGKQENAIGIAIA